MPSKKKRRPRGKPKRKSYRACLLTLLLLATAVSPAFAQPQEPRPPQCGIDCVPLHVVEEALDEVEAIWEARLNEAVKVAVIPIEASKAELAIRAARWQEEAEVQSQRADLLHDLSWGTGIAAAVFLVLTLIGFAT